MSSYFRVGNAQVGLGRERPDRASARDHRRLIEQFARAHSEGVGLVNIIQQTSTPHPEARDELVNAYRRNWSSIKAVLFVVEAAGFQAAVQRSVMGAVMLAASLRSRIKIVARVEEGLPWFCDTMKAAGVGHELEVAKFQADIRAFCQQEAQPGLPEIEARVG
jgi:hypothetical protein